MIHCEFNEQRSTGGDCATVYTGAGVATQSTSIVLSQIIVLLHICELLDWRRKRKNVLRCDFEERGNTARIESLIVESDHCFIGYYLGVK